MILSTLPGVHWLKMVLNLNMQKAFITELHATGKGCVLRTAYGQVYSTAELTDSIAKYVLGTSIYSE